MKKYSIRNKLITTLFFIGLLINPVFILGKDNTIKRTEPIKLSKPPEPITEAKEVYGKLPMSFEINKGQVDDQVKFFSRSGGYTLFLTGEEAVFSLRESKEKTKVMRMQLSGNKKAEIVGEDLLPGKSNYFIGNNPNKWRRDVSHYAKVRYKEVYAGIDMVYYGNQNQLEYDFIVQPGARTEDIKLNYAGVDKIFTNKEGELVLKVGSREIKQPKPFIYQEKEGQKIQVAGNYEVKGKVIGFKVENYDLSKPLTIDPVLEYSTYLGGNGVDDGRGIAVDNMKSVYVAGSTLSLDFPAQNGYQKKSSGGWDIFITKLTEAGNALVYCTYLGGNGFDETPNIAIDDNNELYITGVTDSTNFPVWNWYQKNLSGKRDAFVTKLNSTGDNLEYSTYLGGTGIDQGIGITVDKNREAYITGQTTSTDFPMSNEYQKNLFGNTDAFVTKLNSTGNILDYSTYLGGNDFDRGRDISVDSIGACYITGQTWSTNFPIKNEYQSNLLGKEDIFITKLNPFTGQKIDLSYSTYLGGNDIDNGKGITVDNSGGVYITGSTTSTNFPVKNGYQNNLLGNKDAFVTMLSPFIGQKVEIAYSTYLGGDEADEGEGIAIDNNGSAYVTGITTSTRFPIKNEYQNKLLGNKDAFVTKLNSTGNNLVYSTYLGGDGMDEGISLAVDKTGSVYVTGYTESLNFPMVNEYQKDQLDGDGFVTKLGDCICMGAVITLSPPSFPNGTQNTLYSAHLGASGGVSPYTFQVSGRSLPPGLTLDPSTGVISGTPTTPGKFTFTINAIDSNCCKGTKDYTIEIDVKSTLTLDPPTLPDGFVNTPYTQTITANGGTAPYRFTGVGLPAWLQISSDGILSGTPTTAGTFSFTVNARDSFRPVPNFGSRNYTIAVKDCSMIALTSGPLSNGTLGNPYNVALTATGGGAPYNFSLSGGALPDGITLQANGTLAGTPTKLGTFTFKVKVTDASGCIGEAAYSIQIDCPITGITPSTLPNGKLGTIYNQTLAASGGVGPYIFNLIAGQLPRNLTLSPGGVLSGDLNPSVTLPGVYNFTVEVMDTGTGCKSIKDYSLNIIP